LDQRRGNGETCFHLLAASRDGGGRTCGVGASDTARRHEAQPGPDGKKHRGCIECLRELLRWDQARCASSWKGAVNAAGETPLHVAAACGNEEAVRVLVDFATPLDAVDRWGESALWKAVQHRHGNIIRLLLRLGADPTLASRRAQPGQAAGWTALHLAADLGATGAVELLVAAGANTWVSLRASERVGYSPVPACRLVDSRGETPAHIAARRGDEGGVCLDSILRLDLEASKRLNKQGQTPLLVAAEANRTAAIRTLLRFGPGAESPGAGGLMAVHTAAMSYVGTAEECGIPPDTEGYNGGSEVQQPLSKLEKRPRRVVLRVGLEAPPNDSSTSSVSLHRPSALEFFLPSAGALADIEATDDAGFTAVHWAVAVGNLPAVRFLHRRGAAVDRNSRDGWTPLHLAAREGHGDVVKYLLGQGADVNRQDSCGNSPLHLAAASRHFGLCQVLLDGGARSELVNEGGLGGLLVLQRALVAGEKAAMLERRVRERRKEKEDRQREIQEWQRVCRTGLAGERLPDRIEKEPVLGEVQVDPIASPKGGEVARILFDTDQALRKEGLRLSGSAFK